MLDNQGRGGSRFGACLLYAQEKAELECLLRDEAARSAGPARYLRPSVVLGPHAWAPRTSCPVRRLRWPAVWPGWPACLAVAALPFLPPIAQWVETASHPAIMDTTRAKRELG